VTPVAQYNQVEAEVVLNVYLGHSTFAPR
jgi:hypothetical protein